MSPKKRKNTRVLGITQKIISTIPSEILRISIAIVIVLGLTWGIAKATENELESATNNFSVIGTVSSISDETISLIGARGTDTKDEELYNLNIKYLDRVETKEYQPLIISDIKPGDTIVAQGLTNGSTFFIKRIVSFGGTPLPIQEETATTTEDVIATSTEETSSTTEDVISETPDETLQGGGEGDSTEEDIATTTPVDVQEETATTTEDVIATSTEETSSTTEDTATTTPIIDTVTEIIEDGLDQASDILDTIIDTLTGAEEPTTPEANQEPESEPEPNSSPQ